jgi:hypothetical protein
MYCCPAGLRFPQAGRGPPAYRLPLHGGGTLPPRIRSATCPLQRQDEKYFYISITCTQTAALNAYSRRFCYITSKSKGALPTSKNGRRGSEESCFFVTSNPATIILVRHLQVQGSDPGAPHSGTPPGGRFDGMLLAFSGQKPSQPYWGRDIWRKKRGHRVSRS